jgi:hypothetical protein
VLLPPLRVTSLALRADSRYLGSHMLCLRHSRLWDATMWVPQCRSARLPGFGVDGGPSSRGPPGLVDQALCVQPQFSGERDQPVCVKHDAEGEIVLLTAQCLIPGRAFLQFGAHCLIAIAKTLDEMPGLSALASRASDRSQRSWSSLTLQLVARSTPHPTSPGPLHQRHDLAHEALQLFVHIRDGPDEDPVESGIGIRAKPGGAVVGGPDQNLPAE